VCMIDSHHNATVREHETTARVGVHSELKPCPLDPSEASINNVATLTSGKTRSSEPPSAPLERLSLSVHSLAHH
jgi:hypothetical protein